MRQWGRWGIQKKARHCHSRDLGAVGTSSPWLTGHCARLLGSPSQLHRLLSSSVLHFRMEPGHPRSKVSIVPSLDTLPQMAPKKRKEGHEIPNTLAKNTFKSHTLIDPDSSDGCFLPDRSQSRSSCRRSSEEDLPHPRKENQRTKIGRDAAMHIVSKHPFHHVDLLPFQMMSTTHVNRMYCD